MPPRTLVVLLLLALSWAVGCRQPADYRATRERCGLAPDDHPVGPFTERGQANIDAACAEALGADFGVDWASFSAHPGPVQTGDPAHERLLGGLFAGLAADFGPISHLMDDPDLDPALLRDLRQLARREGLGPHDPAGHLLYALLSIRIDQISLAPDLEHEARYERGWVRLGGPDRFDRRAGIAVWALLAHEAGHWYQGGHTTCPSDPGLEACDDDPSGPLGLEARVAHAFDAGLWPDGGLESAACDSAWLTRRHACSGIVDRRGASPCALPPRDACWPE